MLRRIALAITAAAALVVPATIAERSQVASFSSQLTWSRPDPAFGGWSGLEVTPDGSTFVMISDRGSIMSGRILRDGDGHIEAVRPGELLPIKYTDGGALPRWRDDAEGLVLTDGGQIFISFEAIHRVAAYDTPRAAKATFLPSHPDFEKMRNNSSLEALAIGRDGALYAIPERSGGKVRPFPVYAYKGGDWRVPFRITRSDDNFLVVGADVGPDGQLYVLERKFRGIFGFGTRVRRFDPTEKGVVAGEILFETSAGTHDNLEGLAVWRDRAGNIRLTMVSDNNFRFYQSTEFVEYVLAPGS